jgi:hypothetical protein
MAYAYEDILKYQAERLLAERQEALGMLEAGRVNEDLALVNSASDAILRVDRDAAQLQNYANGMIAQQQAAQRQQQRNPHNFNAAEIEVALSLPDRHDGPRLTREQKLNLYAQNKNRYWEMRRSGQYRDDQGTVRR